jgi:NAD(P)-dependent dehydrogenase (short-subunit alcohol dehydrogenase family)
MAWFAFLIAAVVLAITPGPGIAYVVARTVAEFGTVDILLNNAAIFAKLGNKKFQDISSDEFDAVMAVNVRGPFECAKAVSPIMIAKGAGKIHNGHNGDMFQGAAGAFGEDAALRRAVTGLHNNGIGGKGRRRPHNRPKIMGICHLIQH